MELKIPYGIFQKRKKNSGMQIPTSNPSSAYVLHTLEIRFSKDKQKSIVTPMIFIDFAEGMLAPALMKGDCETIFLC